ncbi:hypothetical protein [Mucilaginibacter paludis]|uniref:Uncharacterized protein n=1 Tax=Mucilaginibacter paludis DSM 18603 TaxID=714943 RepID=H1YAZ5_9SPHI|nr:hypothetical protein [Mucilaginibacter paludis]EHQ30028.1 hypothetical protein Mucpa_5968 [Mucilaginibacter paludis DSM 18603]
MYPTTFNKSYLFKVLLAFAAVFFMNKASYAQVDTLVANNQKIACSVKEITPDAVKYTLPGEDLINSVYKNTVQQIIFKNGRVQTFAESTSYKSVTGVMDFDNVTITSVESEVKGLFKITDVGAKAKGTTVYANQERVKDRAYHKLKLQAAMFGANIIYLSNQRTEGNKYGSEYTSGSTTETNLTGIAYSNVLPDFEKFKKLIGSKTDCVAILKFKLGPSFSDVSSDAMNEPFKIASIRSENGLVFVDGDLKGEDYTITFQLVNFTDKSFTVAYKNKGTAYSFVINI